MTNRLSIFLSIVSAVFLISACGQNMFKNGDSDSKKNDDAKFYQAQIDLNNKEYDKVVAYCKSADQKDERVKDVCIQARLASSGINLDLIATLKSHHDPKDIIASILPSDLSPSSLKADGAQKIEASQAIIDSIYGDASSLDEKKAIAQNLTADQSFQVVTATMTHITGILEQVSAAALASGEGNASVEELMKNPQLISSMGGGIYSQYAPELDKLYGNLQFLHTGQDGIDKAILSTTSKVGNQTLSEALLNNLLKK